LATLTQRFLPGYFHSCSDGTEPSPESDPLSEEFALENFGLEPLENFL
jgi:hypothetical protein